MYEEYTGGYEKEITGLYLHDPKSLICKREDATVFDADKADADLFPSLKLPARTLGIHIESFRAGELASTHRHNCEAIIHIIKGRGYSIIEGERIAWEEGDTLFIPPMTWHQHGADTPAKFVAVWNVPLMERLGMYYVEEAEDPNISGSTHSRRTTLLP